MTVRVALAVVIVRRGASPPPLIPITGERRVGVIVVGNNDDDKDGHSHNIIPYRIWMERFDVDRADSGMTDGRSAYDVLRCNLVNVNSMA